MDAEEETGNDIYVLADSIGKILIKKAKQTFDEQNKKLVLIFEDMEYSDKNSLDLIKALCKNFAKDFLNIPIIIVICYREIPNSDLTFNNEGMIKSIVLETNKVSKKASIGGGGFQKMLTLGIGGKKKKQKLKEQIKE